jgi:hypothetical protein
LIDKPSGRFVVHGIALEMLISTGTARPGATRIEHCRPDLVTIIQVPVSGLP